MIKTLFITIIAVCSMIANAQDYTSYEHIKLEVKEDYTAAVETTVLEACDYILSTPLNDKDLQRLYSTQFLIRWMTGTPHHKFDIGITASKISKVKKDLLVVYLAGMTKYSLSEPEESKDPNKVLVNTVKTILSYCVAQNVKLKGELNKLHEANEKGKLEEYLINQNK